jgi:hypothetical protein
MAAKSSMLCGKPLGRSFGCHDMDIILETTPSKEEIAMSEEEKIKSKERGKEGTRNREKREKPEDIRDAILETERLIE